jgi:predicted ester cyclase
MMRTSISIAAAVALLATSTPGLSAAPALSRKAAAALVQPYYDALLARTPGAVRANVEAVTTPSWHNCTDEDVCETREAAIKRWSEIRSLIPDFSIKLRDVLVAGDKIIVRGELSGRPVGPLMDVDPQGRSFHIMTTDIHDIARGKIVHSYHLEDWGRGIEQMRGEKK